MLIFKPNNSQIADMPSLRSDCLHSPKSFNRSLGGRIREVRGLLDLTQRDIAARSFLRPDLLSKYESGTHPPSVRSLHRIAQALGKPVDTLLPELVLAESVDRDLYRFFRSIWFLPLESRRIIASVLSGLFAFPTPLAPRVLPSGEPYAPRR
jgi:transcriptional regulator with XRE-family HTH domain